MSVEVIIASLHLMSDRRDEKEIVPDLQVDFGKSSFTFF